ncbi:inhibin beta B chain [Empidonax traillii]|uniref:inhibin beta B chain n=1 Tax=Empidonax traillii TaxID=164674 RepID=UPI000FFCECEC|nr:inhibin beta B chain [Empidonax traillii]
MDGAARRGVLAALLACGLLLLGAAATPTPPAPAGGSPQDTCTSCGFRRPEEPGKVDGDFLEAVKRHILSRLQMRDRPNITHAVPKAAMVTALRKLHAGKVREDGRVEIPSLDGQASAGPPAHDPVSEIISFAETGGRRPAARPRRPRPPARPAAAPALPRSPPVLHRPVCHSPCSTPVSPPA